jgi:hypothetical protein
VRLFGRLFLVYREIFGQLQHCVPSAFAPSLPHVPPPSLQHPSYAPQQHFHAAPLLPPSSSFDIGCAPLSALLSSFSEFFFSFGFVLFHLLAPLGFTDGRGTVQNRTRIEFFAILQV